MPFQSPFGSPFPANAYPAPFAQAPRPTPTGQRPPVPVAAQPRVLRGQTGDQPPALPRPAPQPIALMRMPSPEELGLNATAATAAPAGDWDGAHRRLQALGATGLHLDPLQEGGWRVSFTLPAARPDQARRIQAQDATPELAVRRALTRADELLAHVSR